MSGRSGLALGLMYGFAIGMATCGLLDHLEAHARAYRRPTNPARVVLSGRNPA